MGKVMAQSGLVMHCVQAVRMEYHSVYTVDGVYTIVTTWMTFLSFVKVSGWYFEIFAGYMTLYSCIV